MNVEDWWSICSEERLERSTVVAIKVRERYPGEFSDSTTPKRPKEPGSAFRGTYVKERSLFAAPKKDRVPLTYGEQLDLRDRSHRSGT